MLAKLFCIRPRNSFFSEWNKSHTNLYEDLSTTKTCTENNSTKIATTIEYHQITRGATLMKER